MLSVIGLPSAKSEFHRCPNPHNSPSEFYSKDDMGAACIMSGEGGKLYRDESITNGDCTLTMQGDGNLILWRSGTVKPAWQTGTSGYQLSPVQSFYATMQPDANLVVYLFDENVPETEIIPVFDTKTYQNTEVAELWMSDGSQGYCRLYILGDQKFIYDSVITTEFKTVHDQRPYLLESQMLLDPHHLPYSMILQQDCNVVAYSKRYGDLADISATDIIWSAGYSYEGNDKDCVFTQETDGSFSIYMISENVMWDKVWSHSNYRMGFVPNCTWWITKVDSDGPDASCIQRGR